VEDKTWEEELAGYEDEDEHEVDDGAPGLEEGTEDMDALSGGGGGHQRPSREW